MFWKTIRWFEPSSPHSLSWVVAAAGCAAILTATRVASAGLPEMELQLNQRARAEWFQTCPDSSTTGVACAGTICGIDFNLAGAADLPPARPIVVDENNWDLHAADNTDRAVAEFFNQACNGTVGATTSAVMQQLQLTHDFVTWGRWRTERRATGSASRHALAAGGALEYGSHRTASVSGPFAYARSFADDFFFNVGGRIAASYVPGLALFSFDAQPSIGFIGGNGNLSFAAGGYSPLALGMTSYAPLEHTATDYTVGLGGVGIVNAKVGDIDVAGGAVLESRYTDPGVGHLPLQILLHAARPVSLVDAFISASLAGDPLYPGTIASGIRLGVEWGDWQFGYQMYVARGYLGHQLGTMHRRKLDKQEVVRRPAPRAPSPADSTRSPAPAPQPTRVDPDRAPRPSEAPAEPRDTTGVTPGEAGAGVAAEPAPGPRGEAEPAVDRTPEGASGEGGVPAGSPPQVQDEEVVGAPEDTTPAAPPATTPATPDEPGPR